MTDYDYKIDKKISNYKISENIYINFLKIKLLLKYLSTDVLE